MRININDIKVKEGRRVATVGTSKSWRRAFGKSA